MDTQQLIEHLRTTPPSCIRGFQRRTTQLAKPFDDNPCSVWSLDCPCGGAKGRFLGYPLSNYNDEVVGSDCFIGPLAFKCDDCGALIELLDTGQHGYHAEVSRRAGDETSGSANYRGDGPRQAFECPDCEGEFFALTVGFVFWDPDELADEFDTEWEDLFSVFICKCKCADCGCESEPTEFGKL